MYHNLLVVLLLLPLLLVLRINDHHDLPFSFFDSFKIPSLCCSVYLRSRKSILDEIAQLENDTHPGYNEKVVQLKRDHDTALKMNERYNDLEMLSIEEEYTRTQKRIESELKDSIAKLESTLKHEVRTECS